jgi:hypothetical protein
MAGTLSMLNVMPVILHKTVHTGQNHVRRFITNGTVSGIHDIPGGLTDQIQRL